MEALQIEGDVVLAGHSYGGPVITYAGAKADNVKALVYVASVTFDQGMSMLEYMGGFADSELGGALEFKTFPGGDEPAPEGYINRDQARSVLAADLPEAVTRVNAATQRPAALNAFGEPLAIEPAAAVADLILEAVKSIS